MRITRAVCDLIKVAHRVSGYSYKINGVCLYRVNSNTVRAEAIDGCRLVRLEWADRGKGKFRRVLSRKGCVELRKVMKINCRHAVALVDETSAIPAGQIRVSVGGSVLTFDAVPGKFPNLDRSIPRYGRAKAVQIGVNPKIWNGVMKAMSGKDATTVTVKLPLDDSRKSPVLFRSTIDDGDVPIRATGVLMQRT